MSLATSWHEAPAPDLDPQPAPNERESFVRPDASAPDWTREAKESGRYDPSRELLAIFRQHAKLALRTDPMSRARRRWLAAQYRLWSAICGADIPLGTRIGGGLLLPHPTGVVIHPAAVLGPNCLIMSGVTIGASRNGGVPVFGGGVDIGTGAKILGPVRIGDHAQIGANAVIVADVPAGTTAVGVPSHA